jgi:adhesin transport system membrane fusion protein
MGNHQESNRTLRRRVRELLLQDKAIAGTILVYAAASGLMSLAVPLVAQSLVTSVAATGLLQPVIVLAVALFTALLLVGAFATAELHLTELVLVSFFRHSARRFAETSKLTHGAALKFYDTIVVQKSLSILLTDGPTLALQLLAGLLLLAVYHPILLFFALAFLMTIAAFLITFAPRGERAAVATSREKHATAHAVSELVVNGSPADVEAATERYVQERKKLFSVLWKQALASHAIVAFASALFLAIGSVLVMQGQLSLGQLIAADIVVALLAQNLMKLPKLLEKHYELAAALAKLDDASEPKPFVPAVGPRPVTVMARLVLGFLILTALALILAPWQQTAFSQGRVIAYAPADRQQAIEAPIEGRVLHWHVQEGQTVKAGDPIVDISDNDPEILVRLRNERDAVERRLDATRRRTLAIEERITSLQSSRQNGVAAAESRVLMAKQRIVSAERALDAARATVVTTTRNLERQKLLLRDGLASDRTLELSELDHQRAIAEEERAVAGVTSANDELAAVKSDKQRIETDAGAQIGDARASLGAAEAEMASASAELSRMDVRLSRQATQAVKAPRDGIVLRVIANSPGGAIVKSGDILATLVPETQDRAVELYVDGMDAPLIQADQKVRLQFEGWPALQFSGWPSVAVGTFAGRVALLDSANDDKGRLRALIVPSDEPWPDTRFLRQGVRAQGWVLLSQVRLGFELWRRLNGFTPSLPDAPKSEEKAK